mgnify:CR=1 FL=1
MIMKTKNFRGGFTLLFAVLISTLLLAIGVAIYNITVKQVILSAAGRDSQLAFYAADTGAECAIYWDLKNGATSAFNPSTPTSIVCNNQSVSVGGAGNISTFSFNFAPDTYCVTVQVTKGDPNYDTIIESRGYNVGEVSGNSCVSTDSRRLERAVRVRY